LGTVKFFGGVGRSPFFS